MAKLIATARAVVSRNLRRMSPRALAALALSALMTAPARAQDLSPIDNFFSTIGTALSGTTGRAIGFVAVCAIGITLCFGRMNFPLMISIFLGLVIMFGSATILAGFA